MTNDVNETGNAGRSVTGGLPAADIIERGAEAMRQKRRELIAQPLDRIWPELMRAAIEAMREPTDKIRHAFDRTYEAVGLESGHVPSWTKSWTAAIDAALEGEK